MVFLWRLSDSKSSHAFRTLLSILGDLNNTLVRMVSACPLIFKFSSFFYQHFEDRSNEVVICISCDSVTITYFSVSFGIYSSFSSSSIDRAKNMPNVSYVGREDSQSRCVRSTVSGFLHPSIAITPR